MQLIRCTKKLQKEMELKKSDLSVSEPKLSFLGQWHANLIYIDRRKCILLVNDKTLFNFIIPNVSRAQIRKLDELFKVYFEWVLAKEGFGKIDKERIINEYQEIEYSNTNNKSVLGSMNDLTFHYKYLILSEGGIHSNAIPNIINKLNRMPMGALEYRFPIEVLKANIR